MNIIIVGAGAVGSAICAQLVAEGHNITLIDGERAALDKVTSRYDVVGIKGHGANVDTLREAGAEHADMLVAVTAEDEVNILCCAGASKLGVKHTVARVRSPEYSELVNLMKDEMNISFTINPELAAAKEIYRMLRFPSATKIETFCKGRVDLAELTIDEDSVLVGRSLNEIRGKLNIKFLICAVLRGEEAYIPSGDFVLQAGDVISFTAPDSELAEFFKAIGAYKHPVKNTVIAGCSRVTYYLEYYLKQSGIRSTVIDKDKERCRELAEFFKCTVICDDPTNEDVLLREGIDRADAFVAISDVDQENAIVSMYAKTLGEFKTVTMIRDIAYFDLFRGVGLGSIVSPKSSTAAYILRYVRSLSNAADYAIESLHRIVEDKVEASEFKINDSIEDITDIPFKSLKLKSGILVAAIVRGDEVIIPSGNDFIAMGDTVIIIARCGQIKEIKEILK